MEMDLMRDVQYTKTCCYGTIDPYIVQIHSVLLVLVLIYNKGFQARHLVMRPQIHQLWTMLVYCMLLWVYPTNLKENDH